MKNDRSAAQPEELDPADHRRLGPQLGLFRLREEAPGMPFWLPRGVSLLHQLEELVREQLDRYGYQELRTPQMLDEELWHRSGHYENYAENMFFTGDDDQRRFALKPMNCPGACLVFESERRSYRDLPLRWAEFGMCSRRELSGNLHGLLRVRAFEMDDAHLFCRPDQLEAEVADILRAIDDLYSRFGFQAQFELSTRPDKSIGDDALWMAAETALQQVLDHSGRPYQINPGDGAFYGPKIDVHINDRLSRSWQCGTVQVDFFLPERFDLHYQNAADQPERPVIIHRALLGSLERFAGILIEHYEGRFPVLLAPIQVQILPIADRHVMYANEIQASLQASGFRAEVLSDESLSRRIVTSSQEDRVPLALIVGDRDLNDNKVSPRWLAQGQAESCSLTAVMNQLIAAMQP